MKNEEEKKAIRQFELQLNGVFAPFDLYGLGVNIPTAIDEVSRLAIQLHKRLIGQDVPIVRKGGWVRLDNNS